jgi:hypothetical protein
LEAVIMPTWWLSFSNRGPGNSIGCAIVDAPTAMMALEKAGSLGIRPVCDDTEVFQIDPDGEDVKRFPKDTLIKKEQLESGGYRKVVKHSAHAPHIQPAKENP